MAKNKSYIEYIMAHPKATLALLGGVCLCLCIVVLVFAVAIQGESLELLDKTLDVIDDEVKR